MPYPPSPPGPDLTPDEVRRYRRQLLLDRIGEEGQRRIKSASVLVAGIGGLGSPAALYLAAAGVGRIGVADFDVVETGNLHRQILFADSDVGAPKVASAVKKLRALNPLVVVEPVEGWLDPSNAGAWLGGYDAVIDGTDNFPTRYAINDACAALRKPDVHGSIYRFEGQVSVFWAGRGPCYRCLYPDPPPPSLYPDCATAGVLGVVPGVIGVLQATEAIKLLVGLGDTLVGRLLLFDALEMRFREIELARRADCPACGDPDRRRVLPEARLPSAALPLHARDDGTISPTQLIERLGRGEPLTLLDVRTPEEWAICRIHGARLTPFDHLHEYVASLDRQAAYVVYCHVGVRSRHARILLEKAGFPNVLDLEGGIDAWAREAEPGMPRY